jgi:hypothetical protein
MQTRAGQHRGYGFLRHWQYHDGRYERIDVHHWNGRHRRDRYDRHDVYNRNDWYLSGSLVRGRTATTHQRIDHFFGVKSLTQYMSSC